MTQTYKGAESPESGSPLVSVVVPAYNHELWVEATLASVFRQTLTDFELVVVDDGSSDRTAAIVQACRDPRLRLVCQPNQGTAAAINRGLSLCRGRFIAILNSDDLYSPERLAVLAALLEKNPQAGMVFSRVALIDGRGRRLSTKAPESVWLKAAETEYLSGGDLLLCLLKDNFACTSSNFFFRRQLLFEVGGFRDLRYVNDLDFLLRVLARRQGIFCRRILLSYRQHGGNTLNERKREKKVEFHLETAWILASACADGELLRRWDFPTLSGLLAEYYRLHLDCLLFSLLYFLARRTSFGSLSELSPEVFAVLLAGAERRQEEQLYVESLSVAKEFYYKQTQAWQGQSQFWQGQSQAWQTQSESWRLQHGVLSEERSVLLRKLRERDLGLARAEALQHEIWRSREWYRQQYEMVLNSKRFRFFEILNNVRRGNGIRAGLSEAARLLLPDVWRARLRKGKHFLEKLRRPEVYRACAKKAWLEFWCRRFAVHHYEQRPWKVSDGGFLLSVLVCEAGEKERLKSFCRQLRRQTWLEFEIIFLFCGKPVDKLFSTSLMTDCAPVRQVAFYDGALGSRASLFNRALGRAQGKYIAILDARDKIEPTFFETSLLRLESSPPHFFLQAAHELLEPERESLDSPLVPAPGLGEGRFRPLVFARRMALRSQGGKDWAPDGYQESELYTDFLRQGAVGLPIAERIFKNGVLTGPPPLAGKAPGFMSGEGRLNRERRMQRRARQYWRVRRPLLNFRALPSAGREWFRLDLVKERFVPWRLLPVLKEWSEITGSPLLVTAAKRDESFFRFNQTPNVHVFFPEEFPFADDADFLVNYLSRRYRPRKLGPAEIMSLRAGFTGVKQEEMKKRDGIRVLYVSPWLITGGADTMTVDWFRELGEEWCEKYFATTLPSPNHWLVKIKDYAAGIFDLPALGCVQTGEMVEFLLNFIANQRIDLLHIMNSEVAFDALPRIKESFPDLKVVAQFHCFDYFADGRRTGYPFTVPPRYDHLIDSYNLEYPQLREEIRELYPYVEPGKFKVIHGCVNSRYFNPGSELLSTAIAGRRRPGSLNLLFVGRLDRQKQPLRLLDIAAALRRDGVAFIMHVVGDGNLDSQKADFLARLKKEGLAELVLWYGEQPLESMRDWYKMADILLLTSDWEGVPMVLYQAMAMEVVPVVADTGGCAELVTPACGFLVTEKDQPAGYVAAIKKLADADLRRQMAVAARQRMLEGFSLDDLNHNYRQYYQELLS
ncbi:MAG: glycosyltransferase [Deltaproteobacteria bacterium]|nr:glycosyltransferase [Deltaproteobacteria bacterium]